MIPTPESLQLPRPSPDIVARPAESSTTAARNNIRAGSPLNVYNPNKDVPSSLASLGSISPTSLRNMWQGAGAGGGYMSVHTALTPDITLPSSQMANHQTSPRGQLPPQINMNPLLNKSPMPRQSTAPLGARGDGQDLSDSFDAWTDGTTFSHKSLDAYRMQLWSRMARDSSLAKAGVPVEMRPKFFKDSSICLASDAPKRAPSIEDDGAAHVNPLVPAMGQVVQQAISTRLFSAFLAAFQNPTKDGVDGDKISAVFTGKAKLAVVPNDPPSPVLSEKAGPVNAADALERSFANLKLASQRGLVDQVSQHASPKIPPRILRTRSADECSCSAALSGVFTAIQRTQTAR
jgi:hypothetical protein